MRIQGIFRKKIFFLRVGEGEKNRGYREREEIRAERNSKGIEKAKVRMFSLKR